jgi:hypothetical protein
MTDSLEEPLRSPANDQVSDDAHSKSNWMGKALKAVVAGLLTLAIAPWAINRIAQVSQDRSKRVDLTVNLGNQISDSLTSTVQLSDLFAGGFPPKPADAAPSGESGTVYSSTFIRWTADSSTYGAEIETYFGSCPNGTQLEQFDAAPKYNQASELECGWLELFPAVTDLLEVSATSPSPPSSVTCPSPQCEAGSAGIGTLGPSAKENLLRDLQLRVRYWPAYAKAIDDSEMRTLESQQPGQPGAFQQTFHAITLEVLGERDLLMMDIAKGKPRGLLLNFFAGLP